MDNKQFERIQTGKGFIAALDQSGGSTPKALASYGISENRYSNDEEMFTLVHEMRKRIIKSQHLILRMFWVQSYLKTRWIVLLMG